MKRFNLKIGKLTISRDIILLLLVIIAALFLKLSFEKFDLLNQRFFFDQDTILDYITSVSSFSFGSHSYENTAYFYKVLGLSNSLTLVILTSFAFSLYVCFKLLFLERTLSLFSFIYIISFLLLSSIFLQLYSKDFFVLILLSIPIFYRGKFGYIIFFTLAFLYATYLRQYWFLILGASLMLYIFDKYVQPIKSISLLFLLGVIGLVILAFLFELSLGVGLNSFRDQVNLAREGTADAKTIILPYVPISGPLSEALNAIITWVLLIIPVPLLLAGSVRHILSAFLTLYLFYRFWKNTSFSLKKSNSRRNESRHLIFLMFSFTLVQSIFEPDYGSFLRHLTPVFPLFIYFDILCTNERKKT